MDYASSILVGPTASNNLQHIRCTDGGGTLRIDSGIKKLVNSYKRAFRIPENLNFYSEEDYKKAERKFVKIAIRVGADGLGQTHHHI